MADYKLELHHIDVRGGDATLIICQEIGNSTNIYTILVDTGCAHDGWKKLQAYMKTYYSALEIDLLIISHYHDDHLKGITSGNLLKWLTVKKVCDIGWNDAECYPKNTKIYDEDYNQMPMYVGKYIKKMKKITNLKKLNLRFIDPKNYRKHTALDGTITTKLDFELNQSIYKPTSFELISGSGYYIDFYSAKGMLYDGTNVIKNQAKNIKKINVNANDLSISFVLYHQTSNTTNFSYFSGGDLSGDPSITEYYNLEGPVLELIKVSQKFTNGFDVIKASHHGSDRNNHETYTTNQNTNPAPGFLETLKPNVIIVPSNRSKKVPGEQFIKTRLSKYFANKSGAKAYFLNENLYDASSKQKLFRKAFEDLLIKNSANINVAKVITNTTRNTGYINLDSTVTAIVVTHATDFLKITEPYTSQNIKQRLATNTYKVYFNEDTLKQVQNVIDDESDDNALVLPDDLKSKEVGNYKKQYLIKQLPKMISNFELFFEEDGTKNEEYDSYFEVFEVKFPYLSKYIENVDTKDDFDEAVKEWKKAFDDLFKQLYISFLGDYKLETYNELYVDEEITLTNLLINNPMQVEFNLTHTKKKKNTKDLITSFDFSLDAINHKKRKLGVLISETYRSVIKKKEEKKLTTTQSETLLNLTDKILIDYDLN